MHKPFVVSIARLRGVLCSVGALLALAPAAAEDVNLSYLQGKLPVAPDAITANGPELFGDKVNLYNGALEFEQTDLSLPGNNSLSVALTRRHSAGRPREVQGQFGDWDMEVPRIGGTFSAVYGWVTEKGGAARCTGWSLPPSVQAWITTGGKPTGNDVETRLVASPPPPPVAGWNGAPPSPSIALARITTFLPFDYWQGTHLQVPGQGSQELLTRAAGYTLAPAGATTNYPVVTRNNWQIGCLPTIVNGTGEGFFAISPEGVRYRFDWMASRAQPRAKKEGIPLTRKDVYLMATEVTDRFGNWVRYSYDPATPLNLTRIEASDGRRITVTNVEGRAVSATDGTRTYTYGYTATRFVTRLTSVTQPDGARWTFDMAPLLYDNLSEVGDIATCDFPGSFPSDNLIGRMTHPSGASATFTTTYIPFGRTGVPRYCWYDLNTRSITTGAVWPKLLITQALTQKKIEGPAIGTLAWNYSYTPSSGWDTCTTCLDTSTTTVVDPGSVATRHVFGNRWRVNDGQLLQTDEGWNGSSSLRTTSYRYRSSAGQTFPDQYGTSLLRQQDLVATRNLPQDQRVAIQQSTTFSWEVDPSIAGFDAFARPTKVRKFSSLGDTRTETTVHEDNSTLWVLGQVKSVTEGTATLREMESHTYHANTALLASTKSFGKLMQSFAYYADGTVATVSDPAGRVTVLQSYMRGSPQLVTLPDGSRESQVINNLGRPSSRTDAVGYTTGYEFDPMGRVSKVIYPGTGYNPTLQGFAQVQSYELGLPPGHWRQTISTGNALTVRFFDALWRKRVEQRYDTANPAGTASYQETRYDARGQKSFESYPERGFSGVDVSRSGTRFEYDGLSRPTRQISSSELGELLTATQYPSTGFTRVSTNARGYATVFSFQAFDTPSEDSIRSIQAPEGVQVSIVRDVFGKPLSITRGGGGVQVSRSYTYDAYQRLCKTIEPETGATQQDYDPANNVAWRASGLNPQGGACNASNAPPQRRVNFGYDTLNRLTTTTYGDNSPWVSRSYWPDGLTRTIQTPTSTWVLDYSPLRKLQSETLSAGSLGTYNFSYGFNANGSVASMTYPGGPTLQYSPDAFGRPTTVPGYLNGASYYPNGQLAAFTAANGVNYSAGQNLRLLPSYMSYGSVSAETYQYDANANVSAISGVNARSMSYDGLDRLRGANGIWGQGLFSYDTLDNITSSTVGGRALLHDYLDGTNRLTGVRGNITASLYYDANGNVVNRAGQGFSFDIGNRLTTATNLATYYYDGLGRRAYTAANNGRTTLRMYGQAGQLLMTIDNVKGATQHFYLGSKLVAEYNSQTAARWVHADALGSPIAATRSNGSVVDRTYYESYGSPTANGSNPDGIGFTGHVNDVDTGLVYMQQRYYDPIAGRFLSVDPVVANANTGRSFNRFAYGENNPYKYYDPDGRDTNPVSGESRILDRDLRTNSSNPKVGKFGFTRSPGNWNKGFHGGVDIKAPVGTSLKSPISGIATVTKDFEGSIEGNMVKISGSGDNQKVDVSMMHLGELGVKSGDKISEGQVIGRSGDSGNAKRLPSAEAHVHMSVKVEGKSVDPQAHFDRQTANY